MSEALRMESEAEAWQWSAVQLATLWSQDRLGSGNRLLNYGTDSPINQEWSWEEESEPVSYWFGYC